MNLKNQKGNDGAELVGTIVASVVICVIVGIGSIIWNNYSCGNYGDLTNRTTKFSIVNGCFVQTDSGWIPQEEMSKRAYGNSITGDGK